MNTGDTAGSWRDAIATGSREQRSRGSRPTGDEGSGVNQDLNRGFRDDDQETGEDGQNEEQQMYDDEGYYDQEDTEEAHTGEGE